jgi:hypothetical protein
MGTNRKELNKCIECRYITSDNNIGDFVCKKCLKKLEKPIQWKIWMVCIFGSVIVLMILWFEYVTTFIMGFLLGLLIKLLIPQKVQPTRIQEELSQTKFNT